MSDKTERKSQFDKMYRDICIKKIDICCAAVGGKTLEDVANKFSRFLYGKPWMLCVGYVNTIRKDGRRHYMIKVHRKDWEDPKNKVIVGDINSMMKQVNALNDCSATIGYWSK